MKEIETVIKRILRSDETFELGADNNTLKCEMITSKSIAMPNSVGELSGFKNQIYGANIKHRSDTLVNITRTNCIYILIQT